MKRYVSINRKKAFLVLLFFIYLLLLTGCWDRIETNEMAIVLTTAIDKSKDQTKVSVQILIPQGEKSGQHGAGGEDKSTIVRTALGKSITDAMSKIQAKTSRELFWGQCRVYIFGEQLAKEGLHDEIDFLVRHPEPRNRSYLFVSEGEAAHLLTLQSPLEGYIGQSLRKLADERMSAVITLKDFQQMITGQAGGAILPYINTKTLEQIEEKETLGPILETSIFKRDKMIGKIDQKMTKGVLWLRNEIQEAVVAVKPQNGRGTITMELTQELTDIVPKIENNKWKIVANIRTEGSIVENATDLDVMKPEINKMIQKKLAKDIQQRITQTLEEVQKGMKADIFHFAEAFERKYPDKWDKAKAQWNKVFPQVEVDFDIKAYVRRPGVSTRPAGLPKQKEEKK
ncbi:Ger(x)C family spore germination protein [Bacillus clarus]|uniref:Ger(X)C family spore germination protein n=1 Tax=Bacillus clarus TaxID=2338372 RepID=A0A090YZ45_9BACI|nr:Ger(x)C family spore germination protein [Bacillus clarus]KFN03617.1 germination, Ger(x)C family protein [Bacillus clarus]RFT65615.1 Ger(x)C family spore germination protein [Bacillus clarus]